mgnify:CR=1 FL=1
MLGLVGGIVGREKFKPIERLVMIEPSTKIIPRLQVILDKGLAKGIAQGEAQALLKFLAGRGLQPTDAQRQRILSCSDSARLETWIARAAKASSVAEVLGPSPRRAAPRG